MDKLEKCFLCGGEATIEEVLLDDVRRLGSPCIGKVGCAECDTLVTYTFVKNRPFAVERWNKFAANIPKPCPFCGEKLEFFKSLWEYSHPKNNCLLDDAEFVVNEYELPKWNRRTDNGKAD